MRSDVKMKINNFSAKNRNSFIKKMQSTYFDLVVVGGGILGAGICRDATSRGMKVALLEQNDFAFGTSSRSSKLVHGGLRYLENLHFSLVLNALSERQLLLENAPNLVFPIEFTMPVYKNSRVGMVLLGLGMLLYDALSFFDVPRVHQKKDYNQLIRDIPFLNKKDLLGGYTYYDAGMYDDLLTLATLRSAVENGAFCVNYLKAETNSDFFNNSITAYDRINDQKIQIKAKHVVLALGPWTDYFASSIFSEWDNILRPSKGIHFTFPIKKLPLKEAIVMEVSGEKRIFFCIPHREYVIIGTTDTDVSHIDEEPLSSQDEVKYLKDLIDRYLPNVISLDEITSTYAGIRPLVKDDSKITSQISREHKIITKNNVTIVAGGKYTTYRYISEKVMEKILKSFPFYQQIKFMRNNTKTPLNPLISKDNYQRALYNLSEIFSSTNYNYEEKKYLLNLYGIEIQNYFKIDDQLNSAIQTEVLYHIENSMCLNLVDFYTRRSNMHLKNKELPLNLLNQASETFAKFFNWDQNRIDLEIMNVKKHLTKINSWRDGLL